MRNFARFSPSESFWQFDPGWRAATMSSEWQQTTFAPGHDTSVTIQHESLPWALPRWNRKVLASFTTPAASAFPEILAGRLPHHVFRGLLSVHSRYGLHTRQVTCMTLYIGGFSRFVTSTTAPIATGWNESCRVGFAPTERPCLRTAHKIDHVAPQKRRDVADKSSPPPHSGSMDNRAHQG